MSVVLVDKTAHLTTNDAEYQASGKTHSASTSAETTILKPVTTEHVEAQFNNIQTNLEQSRRTLMQSTIDSAPDKLDRGIDTNANLVRKENDVNETMNDCTSCRKPSITLSKFKEKRPEPLNLKINSDIPLDLSVKSAGNFPSGALSSIFNLGTTSHQTTLETPRIQWQDNDAILTSSKSRLFSSSNSSNQRTKLTPLIGESPPMTPNTPFMELMFSPSSISARSCINHLSHSAATAIDSPFHTLITSPFELNKLQILDKWAQSNKPLIGYSQIGGDTRSTPRRSCSSDSLNLAYTHAPRSAINDKFTGNHRFVTRQDEKNNSLGPNITCSKKNLISPLAINSLSNKINSNNDALPTKLACSNQQTLDTVDDHQMSSTTNSRRTLTPTSVKNATANLLNIHLSSPTNVTSQNPVAIFDVNNLNISQCYKPSNHSDRDLNLNDPFFPTNFHQHQQQTIRSSLTNFPDLSNNQSNLNAFSSISSLSSSATLNTPTLISPNQMKGGYPYFLPSPTLSPMPSVFELPSPFLMFPTNNPNHQHNFMQTDARLNTADVVNVLKTEQEPEIETNEELYHTTDKNKSNCFTTGDSSKRTLLGHNDVLRTVSDNAINKATHLPATHFNLAEKDLSQLITPADKKLHQSLKDSERNILYESGNEDVKMDIERDKNEDSNSILKSDYKDNHVCSEHRPATVIPQICVSNHNLSNSVYENAKHQNIAQENQAFNFTQRVQRNSISKRALSPKSFKDGVINYHNERLGSSSAPPDVNQRRVRAKLKTLVADSHSNIAAHSEHSNINICAAKGTQNIQTNASAPNFSLSYSQSNSAQYNRVYARPYPEIRDSSQSSNLLFHTNAVETDSLLEPRSNSAEPTYSNQSVCYQTFDTRSKSFVSAVCMESGQSSNSITDGKTPGIGDFSGGNLFLSAQQLQCAQQKTIIPRSISISTSLGHIQNSGSTSTKDQTLETSLAKHSSSCLQQPVNQTSHLKQSGLLMSESKQSKFPVFVTQPNTATTDSNLAIVQQHLSKLHPYNITVPQQGRDESQEIGTTTKIKREIPSPSSIEFVQQQQVHLPSTNHNYQLITDRKNLLYSNDDILQRQGASRAPNCSGFKIKQELTAYSVPESSSSMMGNDLVYPRHLTIHYPSPIDIDSRSDSQSSNSLDFSGSLIEESTSGRSSSVASSSLNTKKFHCRVCPKSFTRSDMLTRHKRLHTGDRPFSCHECPQLFSRSDHLATHLRTHTGEKPYRCRLCPYSACRKDMITRHLKVHSRNPNATEFI